MPQRSEEDAHEDALTHLGPPVCWTHDAFCLHLILPLRELQELHMSHKAYSEAWV